MEPILERVILDENGKLPQFEDRRVKELAEDAHRMKSDDVTEKMVLEDIKSRDIDNLTLVLKASKEYTFPNLQQAIYFMGQSLNKSLLKMGCGALDHHAKRADPQNTDTDFVTRVLDKQMLRKQVRCEHRKPDMYPPEDRWRSGLYMYKANEIAYFISNPILRNEHRRGGIILPGRKSFIVLTNVPQ